MGPELSKFDFEKWAFLRQVESNMKTGERKKGYPCTFQTYSLDHINNIHPRKATMTMEKQP